MRILLAAAVLAGSFALPASAVKDCDGQQFCACGTQIAVGLPGKDPVVSLGRIDC